MQRATTTTKRNARETRIAKGSMRGILPCDGEGIASFHTFDSKRFQNIVQVMVIGEYGERAELSRYRGASESPQTSRGAQRLLARTFLHNDH
jgi:hypothetical protein